MAKINLKTLKKDKKSDYYETTVDDIWGEKNIPVIFHVEDFLDAHNKQEVKGFMLEERPSIEGILKWLDENRKEVAKTIIKNNFLKLLDDRKVPNIPPDKIFVPDKRKGFLSLLEDWVKSKGNEYEFQRKKCCITDWKAKVDFPVTEESFTNSIFIERLEVDFYDGGTTLDLKIEFFPDYFCGQKAIIFFDADEKEGYSLDFVTLVNDRHKKITNDLEDDDFDDDDYDYDDNKYEDDWEDENFYKVMEKCMATEEIVYDFVKKLNSHSIQDILSFLAKDFVYINQMGNKIKGTKGENEFADIFKLFPDYNIKINEIGMGETDKCFIYSTVSGTYYKKNLKGKKSSFKIPAVFIAKIVNKKIKSWQVFSDTKVISDLIEKIEKEVSENLTLM